MLNKTSTEEQAEVARVFKDVRERVTGFDSASSKLDEFMTDLESEDDLK